MLLPSWFRETGGGEQDERETLFLPNLVTWFQRPDFPISSLTQVRWTKVNINEHNNNKTGSSANECGLLQ